MDIEEIDELEEQDFEPEVEHPEVEVVAPVPPENREPDLYDLMNRRLSCSRCDYVWIRRGLQLPRSALIVKVNIGRAARL